MDWLEMTEMLAFKKWLTSNNEDLNLTTFKNLRNCAGNKFN